VSRTLVLVDGFAALLIVVGFVMAFRQNMVRRLLHSRPLADASDEDALTYALRLTGTMVMAFGGAIAVFFTAFQLDG